MDKKFGFREDMSPAQGDAADLTLGPSDAQGHKLNHYTILQAHVFKINSVSPFISQKQDNKHQKS